jgi:lauroyl/myristoyl acyltransferase
MILLRLIAVFPAWMISVLSVILYGIVWPFIDRDRKVAIQNIEHILGLTHEQAIVLCRKVLLSQFVVYCDTLRYVFFPQRVTFEGFEEFGTMVRHAEEASKGRGLVIITAHLGSWELAGHFAAMSLRKRFFVLAKPSKTKWINPILEKIRHLLKMPVLWTDARSLVKDMLGALERGDSLGFVMDQKPGKMGKGISCTFMGVPHTPVVSGPATMIARKDCGALAVYCVRIGLGRYRLAVQEILSMGHGLKDEVVITARLVQNMEHAIRESPEQWAWNYKRWKLPRTI